VSCSPPTTRRAAGLTVRGASGFDRDDRWGHRAGEPNKAVICSIALARLRTDIGGEPPPPPGNPAAGGDDAGEGASSGPEGGGGGNPSAGPSAAAAAAAAAARDNPAIAMAQKLLLFWRKPARRCWWEGVELENVDGVEGTLKVWIRRVWTLEMVSLRDALLLRRVLMANRA
jgi:ATP-binding cassette subfamily F protein 3